MPLAELIPEAKPSDHAAFLAKNHLVTPTELAAATRIACWSQRGVNLLMQRWVNHNTRVVIATQMYQEVSASQFEEADMTEDWCTDRDDDGVSAEAATIEIDGWLQEKNAIGESRQDRLKDEQQRSALRSELRAHLRSVRAVAKAYTQ